MADRFWLLPPNPDGKPPSVKSLESWEAVDLTPYIEQCAEAVREVTATQKAAPPVEPGHRVRYQLVALDDDLGCMVAAYDADTGELLAIGVDPARPS